MKQKKLIVGFFSVLMVVMLLFTVGCSDAQNNSSIATDVKEITVTVVYADKSEKVFEIETEAEYLADAMLEEGLITKTEYENGFYTEIDGVKADYSADKSWWCITKDGQMTTAGMNEQPIADGDNFEITYTIG